MPADTPCGTAISGSGMRSSPRPSISSSSVSIRNTNPWPPASTTPASRNTSSWDGVLANAVRAASTAAFTTACRESSSSSFAAIDVARSTVSTVPSTGSVMARSTISNAMARLSRTAVPSMFPCAATWAMPRSTWVSTTPELPRAPRTEPLASAAATLCTLGTPEPDSSEAANNLSASAKADSIV